MAGGRFSSAQLCFQVEYRTGIARKLESRNTSNSANSSYGVVGILALCAVKPEVYVIRVKLCVSSLAPMNLTQSRPGLNSLACHPTASESWHLYSLGCNFQKSIGRVFAHFPVDSLSFRNLPVVALGSSFFTTTDGINTMPFTTLLSAQYYAFHHSAICADSRVVKGIVLRR